RPRQCERDCGRQEEPRITPVMRERCRERHRDDHHDCDRPVVADDEVVPEAAEPREVLDDAANSSGATMRNSATSPNDNATTNAMTTSSDASAPGHDTPAPSAPQKMPNDVSMTPTANFKVFSGTRDSGACTLIPATSTTTSAPSAPSAASPTLCWAP